MQNARRTWSETIKAITMNIKELREYRNCAVECRFIPLPCLPSSSHLLPFSFYFSLFLNKYIFNVPQTPKKNESKASWWQFSRCQVHVHNCSRCNLKIILHESHNYGVVSACDSEKGKKKIVSQQLKNELGAREWI